jgi:hypothetical protein
VGGARRLDQRVSRSRPTARPSHRFNGCTCCTTNHLPHGLTNTGDATGQRHRPIRASSTIRASRRGRPPKSPGSKPIVQNGLPSAFSQEDPCPRSPDRTHGAGRSLQTRIFMPRGGAPVPRVFRRLHPPGAAELSHVSVALSWSEADGPARRASTPLAAAIAGLAPSSVIWRGSFTSGAATAVV